MKVLVFAQQLVVGGTPLNAIEFATALRDLHGHEVVLFATPGPMLEMVRHKGLRFLPAPEAHFHPSLTKMRALREVVSRERPDIIHAWEWSQCLDAYFGAHLPMGIPMLVTDMLMDITRVLPKSLPTTFGTPELVDKARQLGRRRVELVLPPVDVHQNSPGAVDPEPFRKQYGLERTDVIVTIVSRLDPFMKQESLIRTIDAVRTLGRTMPLRLAIVGGGPAYTTLNELARQVNDDLKRQAVVMTGELRDPRPAYAAADVVVGMGGSALRGLAFGKPVIVVGADGFSAPFTPETAESFFYKGFYGRGKELSSKNLVADDLRGMIEDRTSLTALGRYSRDFVVQRFSLEQITAGLSNCLISTATEPAKRMTTHIDALRTSAMYFRDRVFLWRSITQGQNCKWKD
jgi:L-malate glycosyltransferase